MTDDGWSKLNITPFDAESFTVFEGDDGSYVLPPFTPAVLVAGTTCIDGHTYSAARIVDTADHQQRVRLRVFNNGDGTYRTDIELEP